MWPEAISECPSMCFGSNVLCLHADAACLKKDMCECARVRVCAEAAYPQKDVKMVASLRTERHFTGGVPKVILLD